MHQERSELPATGSSPPNELGEATRTEITEVEESHSLSIWNFLLLPVGLVFIIGGCIAVGRGSWPFFMPLSLDIVETLAGVTASGVLAVFIGIIFVVIGLRTIKTDA